MKNSRRRAFIPLENKCKKNSFLAGFTLIELLIAVLLLGTVVLTGVTIELAMRRMQIKPEAQVKLLDELIPVVERIKKDFQGQIGSLDNASLYIIGGRELTIRVDDGNVPCQIDPADPWHAYRWNGTVGDPIEYSSNNFTSDYERIAEGVIDFNVFPSYNNTALTVEIGTGGYADQAMYLNTTIFSRMTSGR